MNNAEDDQLTIHNDDYLFEEEDVVLETVKKKFKGAF